MALSFPASPTTGQTSTQNGRQYVWSGYAWELVAASGGSLSATVTLPGLGDKLFDQVSLLLHMDGTGGSFVDSSGTPKTVVANGGATQSSAQSKFGGSSFLGGAGKYLSINGGSAFNFGTDDLSVELWAYPTQTPNGSGLFTTEYVSDVGLTIAFSNAGTLGSVSGATLFTGFFADGSWKGISSNSNLTLNQWNHIAVSRINGTYSLYLNGARLGQYYYTSAMPDMQTVWIGKDWGGRTSQTGAFVGYIDEVRITKGIGAGRGYTGSTTEVPGAFQNSTAITAPVVFA